MGRRERGAIGKEHNTGMTRASRVLIMFYFFLLGGSNKGYSDVIVLQ